MAEAFYNHGRWIARCEDCATPFQVLPVKGDDLYCTVCNPDLLAEEYIQHKPGRFKKVADVMARAQARAKAKPQKIKYPKDREKIEKLLNPRETKNMHWIPGETLADLQAENESHGLTAEV